MRDSAPVYRAPCDPPRACRAWEEGEDLDRYAAELRAARGVRPEPCRSGFTARDGRDAGNAGAVSGLSPTHAPQGGDDADEQALYADWDPADREALRRIQDCVLAVLHRDFPRRDLDWIVEECLFQAARMLEKEGALHLPHIGRLERTYSDQGRAGRWTPSQSLPEGW